MQNHPLAITPGDARYVHIAAGASILLTIFLLTLFVVSAALSDSNPRVDATGFLLDVEDKVWLLQASVWIASGFLLTVGPFFFGLYIVFSQRFRRPMQIALAASIITMVLGGGLATLQAAGVGYIVPAWADATTTQDKAALLHDFRALAWGMEALSRMFDLAVTVGSLIASIVMIRIGSRWWRNVGRLGVFSAAFHIPSVVLLFFFDQLEPVHFVADLTFLLWALLAGIGLWRIRIAPSFEGSERARGTQ